MDKDVLGVSLAEAEMEADTLAEGDAEARWVRVGSWLLEMDGVCEVVGWRLPVRLRVTDGDRVLEEVRLGVRVCDGVRVGVSPVVTD